MSNIESCVLFFFCSFLLFASFVTSTVFFIIITCHILLRYSSVLGKEVEKLIISNKMGCSIIVCGEIGWSFFICLLSDLRFPNNTSVSKLTQYI